MFRIYTRTSTSQTRSCSPIGRGGCLKTSQCAGSTPARSTTCSFKILVVQNSCCCSPTGRGAGLRNQRLWVSPNGDASRTTPTSSTKHRDVIQRSEALVWDQGVVGSNPTIPTICPCDGTGRRAGFRDQILCEFLRKRFASDSHQGYCAPVTELEYVLGREPRLCRFKSCREYQAPKAEVVDAHTR